MATAEETESVWMDRFRTSYCRRKILRTIDFVRSEELTIFSGKAISKTSSGLLGPSVPAGRCKRAGSREAFAPSGRHGLNLPKGCQKG